MTSSKKKTESISKKTPAVARRAHDLCECQSKKNSGSPDKNWRRLFPQKGPGFSEIAEQKVHNKITPSPNNPSLPLKIIALLSQEGSHEGNTRARQLGSQVQPREEGGPDPQEAAPSGGSRPRPIPQQPRGIKLTEGTLESKTNPRTHLENV